MTRDGYGVDGGEDDRASGVRAGTPPDGNPHTHPASATEPFRQVPAPPADPFADPPGGQGGQPWMPGPRPPSAEPPGPQHLAAPPQPPAPSMPQPPAPYEPYEAGRPFREPERSPDGPGPWGAGVVAEDETRPPPMPRPRRPLGRRLLSGVIGLALLGGALVVRNAVPDEYEQRYAPMLEAGKVGQEVATSRFSVKVDAVHSARVIGWEQGIGGREKAATDGVFVIVEAQAMSAKEPRTLRAANLVTAGGTRFDPMDKALLAELMEEQQVNPGYWTRNAYVFEVPKDADLAGARLQVSDDRLQPSNFAAGASVIVPGYGVDIDLGLDATKAKRMVQQPEAGRLLPKGTS